ncbi:MAG: endo alpha-1,4 polygalactosaminidase [Acidimicrobiales bacterium]
MPQHRPAARALSGTCARERTAARATGRAHDGSVDPRLGRRRPGLGAVATLAAVIAAVAAGGCAASPGPGESETTPSALPAPEGVALPPAGAPFDYQIGEPYPPHPETRVVSRDRGAAPAEGLYNVCYVNAFQAQPHELAWWRSSHPDLLLRDGAGQEVVDAAWNEVLLDISTDARRTALADVVGAWIDGCAADGFDAVEPDNLDSYSRSDGLLDRVDAAAFATLLAERAHDAGLAIAQKNDTDLAPEGRTIGFDFAVAEECGRWDECDAYARAYGPLVLVVEYADDHFEAACAGWPELSVVRRDVDVSAPGDETYRYAVC